MNYREEREEEPSSKGRGAIHKGRVINHPHTTMATSGYYELEYDHSNPPNENVLRRVVPYVHEFRTFAKGRWLGRQLIEVLSTEFGSSHTLEYWRHAIASGLVTVNKRSVEEDYIFRNSDALSHLTHRHEPSVRGRIAFIGETSALIAVNKPASLPIHPCGAYHRNTLTQILKQEGIVHSYLHSHHNSGPKEGPILPLRPLKAQQQLYFVHRLDRVTSGLVLIAKTKYAASQISVQIRSNATRKVFFYCLTTVFNKCDILHIDLSGESEREIPCEYFSFAAAVL